MDQNLFVCQSNERSDQIIANFDNNNLIEIFGLLNVKILTFGLYKTFQETFLVPSHAVIE